MASWSHLVATGPQLEWHACARRGRRVAFVSTLALLGGVFPEPACRRGCLRACGPVCSARVVVRSQAPTALPRCWGPGCRQWEGRVGLVPPWLDRSLPVGPLTSRWTAHFPLDRCKRWLGRSNGGTGVQRGDRGPTGMLYGHAHRRPAAQRHPSTHTTGPNVPEDGPRRRAERPRFRAIRNPQRRLRGPLAALPAPHGIGCQPHLVTSTARGPAVRGCRRAGGFRRLRAAAARSRAS